MAKKIGFKSYCWAIGTTSYRTDNFKRSIEKQLHLLRQFREIEENKNKKWGNNKKFQAEYYNFLKENNFVKGDAALPDKDAREKTSGLRDIGLLDDERNITEAGLELLRIADSANFSADNFLEIQYIQMTHQVLKAGLRHSIPAWNRAKVQQLQERWNQAYLSMKMELLL